MPADPAIRAALEKAVDASFAHDGEDHAPPLSVRSERRWRVAHELIAFLRAMEGHLEKGRARENMAGLLDWLDSIRLEHIAAAVEEAARDA